MHVCLRTLFLSGALLLLFAASVSPALHAQESDGPPKVFLVAANPECNPAEPYPWHSPQAHAR